MLKPDKGMARKAAESLAVSALAYIAADPDHLGRFLALSGIGPESIRRAAQEPGFLAAVLDHVAQDEKLLTAFADQTGIRPDSVQIARTALSDGHLERNG